MWYEKYLGIPFYPDATEMHACDCAGLVFLVLKNELNLPFLRDADVKCDARKKHILMQKYMQYVDEIDPKDAQKFDIFFQAEGHCWHTGIVVNQDLVLETTADYGAKLRRLDLVLARPTKFYRVKR